MTDAQVLIRTLVELADNLVDDFDVVEMLTLLTDRCCETFGVSDAGLMLAAPIGSDLRIMASSSTAMRNLELYELQQRERPCLDCYRSGQLVVNVDLAGSAVRWPQFTPAAIDAGFRSVSAIPMRLRGTVIGGLNLFRKDMGVTSPDDLSAMQAFADVATITLLQHQELEDVRRLNEQLNHALNSRIVIEQAKGMLAERADLDLDVAFQCLRDYARANNLRLSTLARDFVAGDVKAELLDPRRLGGSPS